MATPPPLTYLTPIGKNVLTPINKNVLTPINKNVHMVNQIVLMDDAAPDDLVEIINDDKQLQISGDIVLVQENVERIPSHQSILHAINKLGTQLDTKLKNIDKKVNDVTKNLKIVKRSIVMDKMEDIENFNLVEHLPITNEHDLDNLEKELENTNIDQ